MNYRRTRLVAALLVLVFASRGARASTPDVEAYEAALAAYEAKQYDVALTKLQEAYSLAPKAIYLYNSARVLEQQGNLSGALETILRAKAHDDLDDTLRALCDQGLRRLDPVKDKAVVRFGSLPPGTTVQLGREMVLDLTGEVIVSPGATVICAFAPAGTEVRCERRQLAAGRRIVWTPGSSVQLQSALEQDLGATLRGLALDGTTILVDWEKVRRLVVSGAVWDMKLTLADGRSVDVSPTLLPGSKYTLSTLIAQAERSGEPAVGTIEPGAAAEVGPGVGPWILVGTGGAAIVAGVSLLVAAEVTKGPSSGATQRSAERAWDDARTLNISGWTVGAVGLAALCGGLGWYFSVSDTVSIDLHAAPGASSFSVVGTF